MATDDSSLEYLSAREALYSVFAERNRDFEATVDRALTIGVDRLGLDAGFLTQQTGDTLHIVQTTGRHDGIVPGVQYPLEQTYCQQTLEQVNPLVAEDTATIAVDESVTQSSPGCYVGTSVFVGDDPFGTLCFVASDVREDPFTDADELFVELVSQLVSQALERREHEQRLAERNAQLEAEKERFRDIAETAFDAIYRIDAQARFTYVSSSAERIVGYAPEFLEGEFFGDYIDDSTTTLALDAFSRVFGGEPVEGLEIGFVKQGGERVVLEINVRPIFDDDGVVVEAQGVARDVTTRVEHERVLNIQHRAIDDAQLGILIAEQTDDDAIVFANSAFETFSGYTRETLTGMSYDDLVRETLDDATGRAIRAQLTSCNQFTDDVLHYPVGSAPQWIRLSTSPVVDDDGDVTHVVQFYQDITSQERTYRLIDVLNRLLRHNLRNDLNVIHGYADSLVVDARSADDVSHDGTDRSAAVAGQRILRTTTGLVGLIDRVQELERYTHHDAHPTRLDPDAMLARIVAEHGSSFPASTVDVTVDTTRDICAGPEFERALSELVVNALKHNPTPVDVAVTVRDVGDQLRLDIVDDGTGIAPFEVASVNAGRETALEHGSRLGLWFVNWIVTQYGGSFRIHARDDGEPSGTIATVFVQGIDDDTAVEDAVQPPAPLSLSASRRQAQTETHPHDD